MCSADTVPVLRAQVGRGEGLYRVNEGVGLAWITPVYKWLFDLQSWPGCFRTGLWEKALTGRGAPEQL